MSRPLGALTELLGARRVALVVYDLQVGILSQLKNADATVANAHEVLEAARASGTPIFFTEHLSLPVNLMGNFAKRQAMLWQRTDDPASISSWFLRGTEAADIAPKFKPRDDEMVVPKIGMSAFEGTFLGTALRDLDLCAFLIVGAATEVGIEPTVRHGADLGFIPIVIEDACAGGHPEAAARSLESMKFTGDAIFTDTKSVVDALHTGHR